MARQPKGRPAIYRGRDRLYHAWLTIGTKPNGKPDRKHIKRHTSGEVADAIDQTLDRLRQGAGTLAKIETLADWLAHFVHVILATKRDSGATAWTTWQDYETICRVHLVPSLGEWRISGTRRRLEPEHIEAMYARKTAPPPSGEGLAASYVHRMHVYLGRALKTAYRRGRADRNVMDLVEAPASKDSRTLKVKPPPYRDACRLIGFALQDELAHRWLLGMIAGPRQGEVLGIRWHRVELDPVEPGLPPHIGMFKQIQRRKWRHGCSDPASCVKARARCRRKPCEPLYVHGCTDGCGRKLARYCPSRRREGDCYRHVDKAGRPKRCPPVCQPGCTSHASTCPSRTGGGLVESDLKTHASEAPMVIGAAVAELLRAERERQIRAGVYSPDGYVVQGSQPGRPMDPRRDYENWRKLLGRAGFAHYRLHAGTRHLVGSTLSATGADLPMIRDILRQADTSVAAGYVGLGLDARHEALEKVAAALIDGDISMILGARKVA